MRTVTLPGEDPYAVQQAALALRRGGLVAFPTDTVYGVGAMVFQRGALRRLFAAKGRHADKAIPILLPAASAAEQVALPLTEGPLRLAKRFWPGPLTVVCWRRPDLPSEINPGPTVGIRVPDHALALALLEEVGPLAATSANRSGGPDNCTAEEVMADLGGRIDLLLDGGRTPGSRPSTVVDCTQAAPVILRAGPISAEDILAAWAGH